MAKKEKIGSIKSVDDITQEDVGILTTFVDYMKTDANRLFDLLWFIAKHQDEIKGGP